MLDQIKVDHHCFINMYHSYGCKRIIALKKDIGVMKNDTNIMFIVHKIDSISVLSSVPRVMLVSSW